MGALRLTIRNEKHAPEHQTRLATSAIRCGVILILRFDDFIRLFDISAVFRTFNAKCCLPFAATGQEALFRPTFTRMLFLPFQKSRHARP
jgi:hypothetical protein